VYSLIARDEQKFSRQRRQEKTFRKWTYKFILWMLLLEMNERDSSRLVLMDDSRKGPCWKKKEPYFNTKDTRYKS